ncbi:MAG: hypothetical protein ABFD75_14220 [Smithella sp.]
MNIDLHIEELILFGFAPGDRQRIAEAVQDELTRLFTGNNLPEVFEQGIELHHLNGGSFAVRAGERPEAIGTRIGQTVYQAIAGSESPDVGSKE